MTMTVAMTIYNAEVEAIISFFALGLDISMAMALAKASSLL